MTERDLLVAVVALGLGTMMVYSAILNEGWCFQMALARKVSERRGPRSARILIGSIGAFVILLGLNILFGPQLSNLVSSESKPHENLPLADPKSVVPD